MKWWLYMTNTSMNRVRYCKKENKTCVRWVDKYLKDCLCNLRDHFSFGFGIVSLIAWGVAEIPQIITNFRTKSSHGVSLLFLLGWFLGDLFNLAGCLLEPATLPTQFYTAILYTISTIVLVLQSMYYDYLYKLLKHRQNKVVHDEEDDQEIKKPLNAKPTDQESIPIPSTPVKAPIRRYYTSARSLAGSDTPPFRSYLKARSGPSAFEHIDHSSSDDEETNDANAIPTKRGTTSLPRQIPRPAANGALMAVSLNLPIGGNALAEAYRGFTGRRMLSEPHTSEHSPLGQWLGWMMAAIYMGGRVPQIVWNIKRGSVEGLNPLMFVFALIANVAYVASILVRHTEWEEIKANMPWLLDAVVCVVLDLFIIMQYVYYKHMRKQNTKDEDQDHYEEAQKPVTLLPENL